MPQVKAIPDGFHTLTPHLTVNGADKAMEFYTKGLGGEVLHVHRMPDGKVMHASIRIGDSILMLNDFCAQFGGKAPEKNEGLTIHVYVDDADKVFANAIAAGATQTMPLMDQFWGDRYGQVVDPLGIRWSIATHVRDVSPEEVETAGKKAMEEMAAQTQQKRTA